ncbi:MAG: vanadium-dependent haloperoxidase [Bacteroidota bacterium]
MKKLLIPFQLLLIAVFFMVQLSCETSNPNWKTDAEQPEFLHQSLKKITDVIVHDIFSPPVASRIYAYSTIAAYETLAPNYADYKSLAGQLTDLKDVPQPDANSEYCYPLAATRAMLVVGKALIFSEDQINEFEAGLMQDFQAINMPKDVYDRSLAHGEKVAAHILEWADKDNYKQTRTFPKFTINDDPARWRPTPPDYMDAIEPHWNKIRPFTLDSTNQFVPPPPTPFDMDEKSKFYEEVLEVYNAVEEDKEERIAIAKFWDCNPYVSHHKGHVMFATKKITPGGHWMGISQIACKNAKADVMKSATAYTLTAISLADAFISCWDEKYRSELIRPETVINTYLDQEWAPVLQTPPFPEYTSGHSVISAAAATALTSVFGDNFAYTDSVEVEFGMPPRDFESFMQASEEAAVSRLYGGIHYSPACFIGVDQGKLVGKHVLSRVKMN